uniref:Uncharacterized protein n=1 Tax=Romanomermis culicivorax TaxID=13658 RepID=A0A915JJZ1_ROMCU
MFCFIVFTVLSIASSKSIFDESLAYVELSDNLVQAVEKVGVEEANTERKKLFDQNQGVSEFSAKTEGKHIVELVRDDFWGIGIMAPIFRNFGDGERFFFWSRNHVAYRALGFLPSEMVDNKILSHFWNAPIWIVIVIQASNRPTNT